MQPEELFGTLLPLGENWRVKRVIHEAAPRRFVISIEETPQLWKSERCPRDGGQARLHDHVEPRQWRHLNVFNHECVLECALPRGKCRQCGHVYRVRPPWEGEGKHYSKEFEAFALTLCREMPVKRAAEILGENDKALWSMLDKHVLKAHARLGMEGVTCVGVDEMSLRKGHHYATVFADLHERRVLYATEGKDHTTWDRFAAELGRHNGHPHALRHVSMDMSRAYRKGVEDNCRNASIVYDKFHLIAHANQAVDEVCRDEKRSRDAGKYKQLKGTRWLWRKNPENLTEAQRAHMESLDHDMLQTSKAYQMKLQLQQLYEAPCRDEAEAGLRAWCQRAIEHAESGGGRLLRPMARVARMIEKHLEGILAHWEHRVTNAYMEALNSVFSATKRKARGYRTSKNLITMLYFVAGRLAACRI